LALPEAASSLPVCQRKPAALRTLIHCTAHAPTMLLWERRYRRWVDAILAGGLGQDQILLVDDGSPMLPGWPDTDIVTVRTAEDVAAISSHAPVVLAHFPDRLGRNEIYDFPGWYRSFAGGALRAQAQGFSKALHIESDAYILSARLRDFLRDTETGWHTLWSAKYNFPEIAIQLVGADQIGALAEFVRRPYADIVGTTHENIFPYTNVAMEFIGERYGEDEPPVPSGADYAAQIPSQREPSYYWWLQGRPGPAELLDGRIDLSFARDANGVPLLGDGWSRPEPPGCWMTHVASVMNLPALPDCELIDMVVTAAPNIRGALLPYQRLILQVNQVVAGEFHFTGSLRVGCDMPTAALRRNGTDRLRLIHPDAQQPSLLGGKDGRVLALMLRSISLQPRRE
jgi:hypothetical protein